MHRYFDPRDVLREWNGKTRFNVRICANSMRDLARASRLLDLPGVTLHRYPCIHNHVARRLAHRECLLPLLKPDNQDHVADIVQVLQTSTFNAAAGETPDEAKLPRSRRAKPKE